MPIFPNETSEITIEDPAKTEIPVLLEKPQNTARVELPAVYYYDHDEKEQKIRLGMHADMIRTLMARLNRMSDKTQEKLYIQGRMPTDEQWRKLENNKVFNFFLDSRLFRLNAKSQKKAIRRMTPGHNRRSIFGILLPKDIEMQSDEAKKFAGIKFSPDTAIDEIGEIPTGWYQAKWLQEQWYGENNFSPVHYYPIFGGLNTFQIGSNDLKPGHIMAAMINIRNAFEEDLFVADPINKSLSEKQLQAFNVIEL